MPTTQQFVARVRQLTAGTPYRVIETPDGCDVTLDVVNATWRTLFARRGLSKVFTHRIVLDEQAGAATVTDLSQQVEWTAVNPGEGPVPVLTGKVSQVAGRIREWSSQQVYGWDADGQFVEEAGYTFSSEEGRALVDRALKEQGWTTRMGWQQKTGLIAAIGAAALALLLGLVLLGWLVLVR
ncbi:hypothetical protein CGZ95_15540 [Enemella evansiae]|uniref:hypothetical protein n=1 Tax=Enemella evansiae TaxID=2016499 RepID=UPI000B97A559|nr:hypothetical protein [Enemella evansiae]OYN97168.1 hypothetical protein CGZ95_15540 [Enemella evansiae]